jgi:hypothetical protein
MFDLYLILIYFNLFLEFFIYKIFYIKNIKIKYYIIISLFINLKICLNKYFTF